MNYFKIFLDIVASIWVIGVCVMLIFGFVFLFDSPDATMGNAIAMTLYMYAQLAGIPTFWLLLRIAKKV